MKPNQQINTSPERSRRTYDILSTLLFYLAILIFIIGFNFSDNPPSGWYQQFMPDIGSKQINDITFLDSLMGFAVASKNVNPDTSSILKTTNSGDNWQIVFTQGSRRFSRVKFINSSTGFISGGSGSGTPYLYKTIDSGNNWSTIPGATLGTAFWNDMAVLSEDTIWLTDANGFNGGVFFTTNGGLNWQQQPAPPSDHIYMFNERIGFIHGGGGIYKTTNSGNSWNLIKSNDLFLDMQFIDSLTGWKCEGASDSIHFTSNGGLNWIKQTIPLHGVSGGNCLFYSRMTNISVINKDTIMGVGGVFSCTGYNFRGIIYRTTNGGNNWLYQLPDTHYVTCPVYNHITFIDKNIGWVYGSNTGAHTITGGDTTWLTGVQKINSNVPAEFKLFQNYPNPFNPGTIIRFEIKRLADLKLTVYDIRGKEIAVLADGEYKPGTYELEFSGEGLSSGVYFYKIQITSGKEIFSDTKRMVLVK